MVLAGFATLVAYSFSAILICPQVKWVHYFTMQYDNEILLKENKDRFVIHPSIMDKHEEKYCIKCNNPFTCKMGDIANCQCNSVQITEATRNFLTHTNFDCLCKDCLVHINHLVKMANGYRFPTQKEMLIEGLHYYKEGTCWVFTELYHMLRGNCCKSDCRHCVYGFKLK